jgi:hypothetical protein
MKTWFKLLYKIITISTQIDLLRQTFVTISAVIIGAGGLSNSAGTPW